MHEQESRVVAADQLDFDRQRLTYWLRVKETAKYESTRTRADSQIGYLKEQIERQEQKGQ